MFSKQPDYQLIIESFSQYLPNVAKDTDLLSALVSTGLATSKTDARKLISAGAVSLNGDKLLDESTLLTTGLLKKGRNKFAIVS